jgi:hypothetical protein
MEPRSLTFSFWVMPSDLSQNHEDTHHPDEIFLVDDEKIASHINPT